MRTQQRRRRKKWIWILLLLLAGGGGYIVYQTMLPWYERGNVIVHGCGVINGVYGSNSKEALNVSIELRQKIIEVDFAYTTDGVLVCTHKWEASGGSKQKLSDFLATKTEGGYTPLTAKEAIEIMAAGRGVYMIVDTKEEDVVRVYRDLYQTCLDTGNKSFLKRMVPQIYSEDEYDAVAEIYDFPQWIFTTYKLKLKLPEQYREVAFFCQSKGIDVVTVPVYRLNDAVVAVINEYDLRCFTHTVNTLTEFETWKASGVMGVYSDAILNHSE